MYKNNEFKIRIRNMANFTYTPELPEYSKDAEHRAKKIISYMDRKYRRITEKTMEDYSKIFDVKVNDYNGRKIIQFIAITRGCNMRKAGSCWNCNYGIKDKCTTKYEVYIEEFERLISQNVYNNIVIGSLGSITDKTEFPREALLPIIDLAIKNVKIKNIYIETHVTAIDEKLVKYIATKNSQLPEQERKSIAFEIGIEDFNPYNRMLINKLGVNNDKIKEVYEMLDKYNIGLDLNLIYGFPFQTEDERIEAMIENIKFANKKFPKAELILFLMSLKQNTIMRTYAAKWSL